MGSPLGRWHVSPTTLILATALLLRLVGIGWGLPHFDAWDDDGVAPRDFLPGVIMTFTPGDYYTYPPVHLLILTVLTLPIWLVGVIQASSLEPSSLVREMTAVPYMTAFAIVGRLVSAAMSVGTIAVLGAITRELRTPRAGWLTMGVATIHVSLTYYGHTTNLDGPYLFWASLAILWLVRAWTREEPRRLIGAALLVGLAVGTKDQAYALFAISLPLLALMSALFIPSTRTREFLRAGVFGVLSLGLAYGLVCGPFINPRGFQARLAFLTGSASRDYESYTRDWEGRLSLLVDAAHHFVREYPLALAPIMALGAFLAIGRGDCPRRRLAGALPLLAALSFILAFNFVALRSEHRFLLPQTVLLSVYAGIGLDALLELRGRRLVWAARVTVLAVFLAGAYRATAVHGALLGDPRYEAEAFLRRELRPGDNVEMWGNNVYLPRIPKVAQTTRLDADPPAKRSYLPGVKEIDGRYEDVETRSPRFLVVSDYWSSRFRAELGPTVANGRATSLLQRSRDREVDRRAFFADLYAGRSQYALVLRARCNERIWAAVDIHESTCQPISVFARVSAGQTAADAAESRVAAQHY